MPPRTKAASGTGSRMKISRPPSALGARPVSSRPGLIGRSASVVPITSIRGAAMSPPNSVASGPTSRNRSPNGLAAGVKRKERDYEEEAALATNINVVVRCRGRNDREVKENSTVVVKPDKTVGKNLEVSMGANAMKKSYNFDRVFSAAASQGMVFDEVVAPILADTMHGFNCTIFAYGQTGTGKTYTMSGDMSDGLGLKSDYIGIIPRVLNALFKNLETDEPEEKSVKCSFIELYNEELRDLIALDESAKLKIYDQEKKGHTSTIVQGMEETHIKDAQGGMALLELGNTRRQVAATKCNDLSSRSHTVFTVTVYTKRLSETGEEVVYTGKLNLVDLAGSENIQRSGAENKRAAEAGLINKSLLTLGRVINALVDKGSHIPYRESKLTRLLQDSLGGRTKTCIIATVSPAKSNLEETISTLDYAFRAKNIKNKPQSNRPISKHTLLHEFTAEIQQLKSELIMTRNRNGVYMSTEQHEEVIGENESLKVLSDEQRAKLEIMEDNLRNKTHELLDLSNDFLGLKQDNEDTKQALETTSDTLEQTNIVLADFKQRLSGETLMRKAHQGTEQELAAKGEQLISTLGRTVKDVHGLHDKLRRKSHLQSVNRTNWQASQFEVSTVTKLVEVRIEDFQNRQQQLLSQLSDRLNGFVASELDDIEQHQQSTSTSASELEVRQRDAGQQSLQAHNSLNDVVDGIMDLRENVKSKVGDGLRDLAAAAGRISAGVVNELNQFHQQLHSSYGALGEEIKTVFGSLDQQLIAQKTEAHRLRDALSAATLAAQKREEALASKLENSLLEEKTRATRERSSLITQITELVNHNGRSQDERFDSLAKTAKNDMQVAQATSSLDLQVCQTSLESWIEREASLQSSMLSSRDLLKVKLATDWVAVEDTHTTISSTAKSVCEQTARTVDDQMVGMDDKMQSLDDFVAKARWQNEKLHNSHTAALDDLGTLAASAFNSTSSLLESRLAKASIFHGEAAGNIESLQEHVPTMSEGMQLPLGELRETISGADLAEYSPTGETPLRRQYHYPKALPRTAAREQVLFRGEPLTIEMPALEPGPSSAPPSPSKETVYTDADSASTSSLVPRNARVTLSPVSPNKQRRAKDEDNNMPVNLPSLREIDANIAIAHPLLSRDSDGKMRTIAGKKHRMDYDSNTAPVTVDLGLSKSSIREMGPPPLKKLATEANRSRIGRRAEGRENLPFDKSVGGRRTLRSSVRNP